MKVVFVEKSIPDYRTRVFVLLHDYLKEEGIDFELVAGQMSGKEQLNEYFPEGDWVTRINNTYLYKDIHYARVGDALKGADMVILHPMNSALILYKILMDRYLFSGPKVGFFGHGGNMNILYDPAHPPLRERMKNKIAKLPDWWFPYTEMSRQRIVDLQLAYPEEQMTVVNNAIDTSIFLEGTAAVTEAQKQAIRDELAIPENAPLGLYCGRLMATKITFLEDVLKQVKSAIPDFHMVIIGKGNETPGLLEFAGSVDWVHAVGPKYHEARYPYFVASDVFINPGYVGLSILDAFASGLPFYTTHCNIHSPEVVYLRNGENGYMTEDNAKALSEQVIDTLKKPELLAHLAENAINTAKVTNMEAMAANFVRGIKQCLGLSKP